MSAKPQKKEEKKAASQPSKVVEKAKSKSQVAKKVDAVKKPVQKKPVTPPKSKSVPKVVK